jgi:MtrB/PioB family decaheme-associated outer membrane protein
MSEKSKQFFRMTPLAAALLAVYGPALAQSTEGWLSIGGGWWSNDRPQTGVYDGMRDSGGYGLFDLDVERRDEATGTWLGLKGRNLGLDNREIKLDWLRQGNIGASIEYNRIPREWAYTANTGLIIFNDQNQQVVNIAPGTGNNMELSTVRDRVTGKFYKNLGVGLDFNASYRHETKNGERNWGRGGAAEFAVEPIDSTIQIAEAALSYSSGKLQLSGGYYGTWYRNDVPLVTTVGAATYNLSEPLDNQSYEIFLNGGYGFTPTTRGTFKASYSRATQNESFPTTTTPGLTWPAGQAPNPLAPRNLNGRLDTTLLEAGLNSRPMQNLSVAATARYRDFSDKTPVQPYVFSATNVPLVYNTPFSYTNHVGKLDATYRLPQSYSALAGVEYNAQDRSVPNVGTLWVPFRAKLDETTYRVGLSKSMSETVNGSLRWEYANRDGGNYTQASNPAGEPLQQNINPMNISDRTRNKWRALVDWSPVDRLALQFAYSNAKDDYDGPNSYGLQEGKAQNYSVDGSYQLSSAWQFHAWYSYDVSRANETTQQTAAVTKFNDLRETDNSFGAGVKGRLFDKLKVGANVEQFKTRNKYDQDIAGATLPATQVRTPEVTNRLTRIKFNADYPVQKTAEIRLSVIHEKWKTDDWTWMMFPASGPAPWPYGTDPADGTTVISDPSQNSTFVGIRYVYKF